MKIQFHPLNKFLDRRAGAAVLVQEEDPATQSSSLEFKFKAPLSAVEAATTTVTKRRCIVRFAQDSQVHSSPLVKEECAASWYSAAEITEFRHQNRQRVVDLRRRAGVWTEAHTAAYRVCTQAQTAADVAMGLLQHQCTVDTATAGLEKKGIHGVAADSAARRKQLWKDVLELQCYGFATDRVIRDACRRITRPSRLYSRHIAMVSASIEL